MSKPNKQPARPRLVGANDPETLDTPEGVARENGWSDERSHVDVDLYVGKRLSGTTISAELSVSRSQPSMVSVFCTIHRDDGKGDVDALHPDALRPGEVETFFLAMAALRERARMDGILPVVEPAPLARRAPSGAA